MLEAATALQTNVNVDEVPRSLQEASKNRRASRECIDQITSTSSCTHNENFEASVLVLSNLSVQLKKLKALFIHQQTATKALNIQNENKTLPASLVSVYKAKLRDQIIQDMESPYSIIIS
ncbi:hypothetical protein [Parasitella parasitica]|uniref:Uncharacterized protein n=1 Tax=Parasitella parasitica TaxID=35722 RepID=A0A0B7NPS7_9FUNG|nr:hypothetical protein [Parasitella parasitica]